VFIQIENNIVEILFKYIFLLTLEYVENIMVHTHTCSFDHLTPAQMPLFCRKCML